jgi:hypothetical protein
MRRAGHASAAAALRYQHATEDRDKVLAEALSGMAALATITALENASQNPADKLRTAGPEADYAESNMCR